MRKAKRHALVTERCIFNNGTPNSNEEAYAANLLSSLLFCITYFVEYIIPFYVFYSSSGVDLNLNKRVIINNYILPNVPT